MIRAAVNAVSKRESLVERRQQDTWRTKERQLRPAIGR
jgi:hypothetical protein